MIKDIISVTGAVHITHLNGSGKVVNEHSIKNIVVAAGKAFIAERMLGTTAAVMSHMGLGTDQTLQTTADTVLAAELGRVIITTATNTANSCLYVAQYAPGICTGEIKEAGIFNAATAGSMLCRTTFPVVNKGIADTIIVSWVITIS